MRRCLVLSGLFVLSFIASFGIYSDSSAASNYDNSYHLTDTLTIHTNNKTPNYPVDISDHWFNYITGVMLPDDFTFQRYYSNVSNLCSPVGEPCGISVTVINELNAMLANEDSSWSVSMINVNNVGEHSLKPAICYNTTEAMELQWTENSVEVTNYDRCIYLDSNSANGWYAFRLGGGYASSTISTTAQSGTGTVIKNFMCVNCTPNYPVGYEGTLIRETASQTQQWDWTPNIKLHSGSDWKIELSDYRFFTTDMVLPFTCGEEEFAPAINWKIYEEVDEEWELVDEMLASASGIVYFQGEKKQSETKYLFVAKYAECENVEFTDESQREFTIDGNGNLVQQDILTSCITEEFPFVDMNGCLKSLAGMLDILAFGGLPVGSVNKIDDTAGCRNLHTLGHWINKPNIQVCPAIPEYVRNIVTPFVTLALGLLIIRLVVGRNEAGVKTW